ncbi:hypothetical protein CesoFtcFv8_013368 [Champsocephalus esox]|uniref:G-protein coupled receptors family 1 profile domain-containing protein n=1 Tax=Champsocephalus esox TaxID=159716 RepID=A0AAN8BQW9_9TELE|nr:hypothetical protein CesoFtcFv8_013368 [Champsocephalus esox]
MTSAGFNVTSSLTLVGFSSMSGHSSLLFFVFLLLYLFVLFSDSLVIYIICSQRALHRPMFAFVVSFLLNSLTGSTLLASRLPLCRAQLGRAHLGRAYCDIYSIVSLSCGGAAAQLSGISSLLNTAVIIFLPAAFMLFSYARILFICLRRSRSFSSKALQTCLPHLLVFFNYSISVYLDLMLRRLQSNKESDSTLITSIVVLIIPTVLDPVVYGLKLKEVFTHVKRLLSCRRDS